MKKFFGVMVLLLLCFPIKVEAKTIRLNESYTDVSDYFYDEVADYKLKVKEAGVYKITISFDGYFKEDGVTLATDDEGDMTFIVSTGNREYECSVPLGETETFTVGLDKGNTYIEVEDDDLFSMTQSTIQIKKSGKKYSFSKAYNYVKKNTKSHMTIKKKSSDVVVSTTGVTHTSNYEEDGYAMGFSVYPHIVVKKQGKSSYASYYMDGKFLLYSLGYVDDSNLDTFMIYSGKNKMTFDLDYSKEKNKYNYKTCLYEDTCTYKCTLFKSYVNSAKDVDKLISILKSKNAKVKIKGSDGAYYYIGLTSSVRNKWIDSLNLYKKLQKKYK